MRQKSSARIRRKAGERGQTLPLGAALLWLVAGLSLLLVSMAGTAVHRARAQTAADAAALAAGTDPALAEAIARRNGGTVLTFEAQATSPRGSFDDTNYVVVQVGPATAHASARGGRSDWQNLHPEMKAALARAERILGRQVPIVSGFRSRSDQEALWNARHLNPYPVARPGTSRHESGLAVDVPAHFALVLGGIQQESGLCQVLPVSDPIHFEPCQMTPTP